jgi:hypothetical protein
MHSPFTYIGQGRFALVCRFDSQPNEGFVWDPVRIDEWLFDHDSPGSQASSVLVAAGHREKPVGWMGEIGSPRVNLIRRGSLCFIDQCPALALRESLTLQTYASPALLKKRTRVCLFYPLRQA